MSPLPNPAVTTLQVSKFTHKSNAIQNLKETIIFHSQPRARRKTMIHSSTPSSIERRLPKSHSIPCMRMSPFPHPTPCQCISSLPTGYSICVPTCQSINLAPRPRKTNCQVNACRIYLPQSRQEKTKLSEEKSIRKSRRGRR
jgi:hypothetical protein